MKKLIFFENGINVDSERRLLKMIKNFSKFKIDCSNGYWNAVEFIKQTNFDYYYTDIPTFLRESDIWYNDVFGFNIYIFTKEYKLLNIKEMTEKELRPAHSIDNMWLNGGF